MKKILIITGIIILIVIFNVEEQKYINIPEESIRYRIIPNSNSAKDINAKEIIQKSVEKDLKNIMNSNSIEETRINIVKNLDNIKKNIEDTKKNINYDEEIKIKYGLNYFPAKEYMGKTYKEGYYESLVVEIGKAEGNNFWCVLFPPLCMMENEGEEEVEYTFFLKDFISKIFK